MISIKKSTINRILKEIITSPPHFFPRNISLDNFKQVYQHFLYPGVLNSLIIVPASTFFVVIIGSLAAFGFSKLRLKGREYFIFGILSLRMLPTILLVIPLFLMLRGLNLIDSRTGMILVYIGYSLPFIVWIMKTFFDEIPKEIDEAALVDGCSWYRIFISISLPLASPGLITATIFSFIFAWNEFLLALILTRSVAQTIPITLASLEIPAGIQWGLLNSLSVIMVIPVVILCVFAQRYMIRGLTLGAVKE